MNIGRMVRKLLLGLLLRCPYCERGAMFPGLFRMHEVCPQCGARFERREGESIGGTMLNLCLAELLTVGGFIVMWLAFNPPLAFQLIFWISFNLLFIVFFYRHARAIWTALNYLSGGVYPDGDEHATRSGVS